MAWKPAPMKVMCPKCKRTEIFAPRSDVIIYFPVCKKCQIQMVVVGKAELLDWVKSPLNFIRNIQKFYRA